MKKHTINKRSSANPSGLLLNANQIAEALVEIGTRNRPFRVSGKFLFLTYQKCPILPEQALQLLAGVFERTNPINKFLIVKENHNDGSKHLHAWVQLSNRYDIKNPSFLYLKDQCGVEYKGNFQTMRKPLAVLEYLRKGLRDIQKESLFQLQKEEQMAENEQVELKGGVAKAYWDDKRRERPGTRSVAIRVRHWAY